MSRNRRLIPVFFLFLCGNVVAKDLCAPIVDASNDKTFVAYLESWVASRAGAWEGLRLERAYQFPDSPGQYAVELNDNRIQERLGPEALARVIHGSGRKVTGIFFGRNSNQGIIVRVAPGYYAGLVDSALKNQHGNISVICIDRLNGIDPSSLRKYRKDH